MGLVKKLFGSYSEREIKAIWPIVHRIEAMEEEYKALTDAQLQAKTVEFKERLQNGETLQSYPCNSSDCYLNPMLHMHHLNQTHLSQQ